MCSTGIQKSQVEIFAVLSANSNGNNSVKTQLVSCDVAMKIYLKTWILVLEFPEMMLSYYSHCYYNLVQIYQSISVFLTVYYDELLTCDVPMCVWCHMGDTFVIVGLSASLVFEFWYSGDETRRLKSESSLSLFIVRVDLNATYI